MKTILLKFVIIFAFIAANSTNLFAQSKGRWADTLEYNSVRGVKSILCGDETFFTSAEQVPYVKNGSVKTPFLEILQGLLNEEKAIDGVGAITVEIVVNCKGLAGSLKLLKYGDKENPADLELVKSLNRAIAKMPTFMPAKNGGRIVNYKQDKLKVKVKGGKITLD